MLGDWVNRGHYSAGEKKPETWLTQFPTLIAQFQRHSVFCIVECWIRCRMPWICSLVNSVRSNISNMRCSVSLPDETPRRELKIRRAAEYFWRTSRCFIWWWNTVSNVWYFFSNKIIFEGEIKDANTKQCFIRFPNTH